MKCAKGQANANELVACVQSFQRSNLTGVSDRQTQSFNAVVQMLKKNAFFSCNGFYFPSYLHGKVT